MILSGHLCHIFIHHANSAYLIFIAVDFEVRLNRYSSMWGHRPQLISSLLLLDFTAVRHYS